MYAMDALKKRLWRNLSCHEIRKKNYFGIYLLKKPKQTEILYQNQTNNRMKVKGKEEDC